MPGSGSGGGSPPAPAPAPAAGDASGSGSVYPYGISSAGPGTCACIAGSTCSSTNHHTDWCYIAAQSDCEDGDPGTGYGAWSEIACDGKLCSNECIGNPGWKDDSYCDDGAGPSTVDPAFPYGSGCEYGTDCNDCGRRDPPGSGSGGGGSSSAGAGTCVCIAGTT